jgi:hypothetical protein
MKLGTQTESVAAYLCSPNYVLSNLLAKQRSMAINFSTDVDIFLRCEIGGSHFRVKQSKS